MAWLTRRKSSQPTQWEPLRELQQMRDRIDQLFSDFPSVLDRGELMTLSEWEPSVDVTEDDNEYTITAELPEVKKDDVKVHVENGVLSLSGERKSEKEEKKKKYHRVERAYGNFVRNFTLPENTNPDKISAEFNEGVLKVHVPKEQTESSKKKEIPLK